MRLVFGVYNVSAHLPFSQLGQKFFRRAARHELLLTTWNEQSISWFRLCNFPAVSPSPPLPIYIRVFYSIGNVTLNTLNFVWFRAVSPRFFSFLCIMLGVDGWLMIYMWNR